jgi:carbamoyltransferase
MNILGINGAIGWDGNIHQIICRGEITNLRIHGSGVTLIMNGVLKNALHEERFSRIKNDGNYPKLSIEKILDYNGLTKHDIDLVVYVCGPENMIQLGLKMIGHFEEKLQEYFPNSKVEFLSHHLAHAAATFYTSGFDEANILTFDGAGDSEVSQNGQLVIPHMKFLQGKDLTLTEVHTEYYSIPPMYESFGHLYNKYSLIAYKNKMNLSKEMCTQSLIEKLPGKVMGLAAFGDHRTIDLPEWFNFDKASLHNSSAEQKLSEDDEELLKLNPDDLAAWGQHQFEKYLLLFLDNIPKNIKSENLCLGGGCALNILANTKILEEGIYKNVHVNTAPNDDGLHFGAAVHKAIEYENGVSLPDDIGYLGIPYTDEDIESALV